MSEDTDTITNIRWDLAPKAGQRCYTVTFDDSYEVDIMMSARVSKPEAIKALRDVFHLGHNVTIQLSDDVRENAILTAITALQAQRASLLVLGFSEEDMEDIDKSIGLLTTMQFGLDYGEDVLLEGGDD